MRVACIGEAMVELSLDASGRQAQVGFAGDTLNTAIYLKRAAPSLHVSYVTRLGRDGLSAQLKGFVEAEGIETRDIEHSETRQVGLYAISTDPAGERSFSYWRGQSAARQMFQAADGYDFAALDSYDALYLSAISLAILPDDARAALLDWMRGFGGQVVFDSNFRPALWEGPDAARDRITEMWRRADIGLPSVDDEMAAFGDAGPDAGPNAVLGRLRALGLREGALKCGAGGPVSLSAPVAQDYPEAERVVDTTAAGDSFNGGYLAARWTGASQAEALMAGHKLAAYVVGHKGAIAPPR